MAMSALCRNISLAVGLLLGLAGCDDEASNRSDVTGMPATIVAAVVPAPPVSQYDAATLEPKGMAIDILNRIAEISKMEIEYVAADWGTMSAVLNSNRANVVAGPIFQTPARAKEFSFTEPVWSYAIVAIRHRTNDVIQTRKDVLTKELIVAVGRGGFDAEFAERVLTNARVRAIPPDNPDGSMLEVLARRADVALVDEATARRFVKSNPQLAIVGDGAPISLQLAGFMLKAKDERFRQFLNVVLNNLAVNGELEAISKRYSDGDAFVGLPIVRQYFRKSISD